MRQIPFLIEHDERTFIREKRRAAMAQLAFGLILGAGCLATGWIELSLGWGLLYFWAFACGLGLVIGGIAELIWIRRLEAKLNRELTAQKKVDSKVVSRPNFAR